MFLVFTLSPCFVYAREQHVLRAGSVDPNPTTSCEYWDDEGVERDDGVCTPNKHCQPLQEQFILAGTLLSHRLHSLLPLISLL